MNMISMLLVTILAASNTTDPPVSCRVQVGHETAKTYVQDCRMNSMSTRPPCNEANPCSMIIAEVVRSCDIDMPGPKPNAAMCERYRKLQQAYPVATARGDG